MNLCGLQKTTLLDYPGLVAATVFTGGCNFRCPFCHNGNLLEPEDTLAALDFFSFLQKRQGVLEGVCVTGGEPTLQQDLTSFLKEIKSLGYRVKLDTNGYLPDVMIALCRDGLVDYVAMDIKSSQEAYGISSGLLSLQLDRIARSADFLMNGSIPYEFRTTVVKELHTEADFIAIGTWLQGAAAYYLQNFQSSDSVVQPGLHSYSKEELLYFADLIKPYIPNTHLRGL